MRWAKRGLALGLSVVLALSTSVTAFAEDVQVFLKDDRPIDIVLAAGKTAYDLDRFEANMRSALQAAGVDLNRVKIEAVESSSSATQADFPWEKTGRTGKVFIGPTDVRVHGIHLNQNEILLDGDTRASYDCGVRYTFPPEQADYVSKFTLGFTLDPTKLNTHPSCEAEFVACGFTFSVSTDLSVSVRGPGLNPLYLGNREVMDLKIEATKDGATIYKNNNIVAQVSGVNVKLDGMKASVSYGGHNCSIHAYFIISNFMVETQLAKDLVDVVRAPSWRNNSHRFVVDVNDFARDDLDANGPLGECIQRLCADDGYYINYGRDESKAQALEFVGKLGPSNMSRDGKRGMYSNNSGSMAEMASWIEYIVNKSKSGDGNVTTLRSSEFQYNVNPRALAANTASQAYPNGKWHTKYTTSYAASADPNFTFEGTLEPPFWTNRYRQDFSFSTAQVGVYDLTFADNPVKPRRIIVHQLPVAKFSQFTVTKGSGRWYEIGFKTNSYDPDAPGHISPTTGKVDNGIVEHIFEFRPAGINSSPVWKRTGGSFTVNADGSVTANLTIGPGEYNGSTGALTNEWELRYTVVDYQGAASMPVIKYINGNKAQTDIKPIAAFEFPNSKYSVYEWTAMIEEVKSGQRDLHTSIQDASYDPMGYPLVKYRWQWLDAEGANIGSEIIANPENKTQMVQVFNAARKTAGTYYLQLIVERGAGGSGEDLISEPYKRVLEFTREAYSMWFSELATWSVIQNENKGKTLTAPPVSMQGIASSIYPDGYNRMTGFTTATIPSAASAADKKRYARRTTFNQLRTGTSTRITKRLYVDDNGIRNEGNYTLNEYTVELTSEFLWPVTNEQIAAGEAMLSLWGTPSDDWAFVPDGYQPVTKTPRYISNVTSHNTGGGVYHYFYIKDHVKWDSHLDNYALMSITQGESYRFAAKTPGHANSPYYVYSSTLDRNVFDWETGTTTYHDGITEFPTTSSAGITVRVPSRFSSIKLQGEGGYVRSGTTNTRESVAAVYFRDTRTENASAAGKLGFKSRDNTTEEITVSGLNKGETKTLYFYVAPETSLITGEVYRDQGLNTTHTYKDDIYSTSISPVNIYRMKDDTRLRLDGAVLPTTRTERNLVDNTNPDGSQKPISLDLSMLDPDAIIRGIRLNGAETWTKYNNKRNVIYNFTPTQAINTVDILVSPEDREIQQLYTIIINVPDTFQSTAAVVSYKTTDRGTFTGVLSGNVFTITVPENVRMGKLCVQAVNQHSVISSLARESYNANGLEIDWELPYHNNPNTTFVVKPAAGSSKTYSIKFVKISTTPDVTVTNNTVLDAIYSPQGRYLSGVYTAYEDIIDAAPAFSGNGVPVELEIWNRETVQGVKAEVVFNGEKFPVHWDTYDGPTYRDGQDVMHGFAVISKTALRGLNGPQPITCNVYTYDYEGSEPVDIANNVAVRNITVDSTGPSFSVSASLNPSMIRFTGILDNMVPVGMLTLEWATSDGSGYDNSYTLDTENHPDIQVRVDGVSEELKCRFIMSDVLGNTTEVENKLDFSGVAGIDVHMEFGRNADGYYVNVRKGENESIGYDRFEFIN